LAAARIQKGLNQAQLAARCQLAQQQVSYFEQGKHLPTLEQLLRLAEALDVPLQWFLTLTDRPGPTLREIAIELRRLGVVDLWVRDPLVPGAFRAPEEIVALAVRDPSPDPRVLEAVPAVLAWNVLDPALLWAYGRRETPRTLRRIAWLAEIVLAIDRSGGFPGGCPWKHLLARFVKRVKAPAKEGWDDLGRPAPEPPKSPVWKRWRISYATDLQGFRERAAQLEALGGAATHKSEARG
jgi:transcriptional regulator with XRE-family HTH domain